MTDVDPEKLDWVGWEMMMEARAQKRSKGELPLEDGSPLVLRADAESAIRHALREKHEVPKVPMSDVLFAAELVLLREDQIYRSLAKVQGTPEPLVHSTASKAPEEFEPKETPYLIGGACVGALPWLVVSLLEWTHPLVQLRHPWVLGLVPILYCVWMYRRCKQRDAWNRQHHGRG